MLTLQPGDVADTYADITELIEQFDYKLATAVEVGVVNFIAWYCDYFKVGV